MKLSLKDDYYEWFCDWCDSINIILIHRVADRDFSCCACHRQASWEIDILTRE